MLDFRLSPGSQYFFFFFFFFLVLRAVCTLWGGWLFLLMTSEVGTHSDLRNVVGKFTSHTVQKPQSPKQNLMQSSEYISEC
jgi:hypothetical protein